ncbi:(4Fe-4S)-binding protein [Clostridium grantii]|uniref:Dissimilatory sulfite reductase (Desulfoviridin), alpha and beta subunits n=1 Tax=Clostridium grantii DSM 8605 TaxID=1121316 RepID=A0A1M5WFA7_9CLOT|nr:(4Fe-4S)-binding protein [Clostridium grantii]SHH86239.1 Dissimilatory sulfite reductase (desulfoviridin), alpha and beta subunits [Clostridium grantii DSM 8605]
MDISLEQRKKLKSQGFLSNKDGEHFSARIITENGVLNHKQLKNLSEAAEKFGDGQIAFTSRMTVEIPSIKFENVENLINHIGVEGMVTGGTGAKVRPVVACKGTVCTFGLIDTQEIATEIHKRFFQGYGDIVLPHKFKIAVGGCPNNCVKPSLNDLGIVGQKVPNYNSELCKGCNKCGIVENCPMKAASLKNKKMIIDKDVCNNCGICSSKCYFGAMGETKQQYKVYIGGRWGKKIRIGSPLDKLFSKEEALNIIENTINLYKDKGIKGERFGETIDRIGFKNIEKILISRN